VAAAAAAGGLGTAVERCFRVQNTPKNCVTKGDQDGARSSNSPCCHFMDRKGRQAAYTNETMDVIVLLC
jgi:hypothetical protein